MSEKILNERLWICDALQNKYKNKICCVPITIDLMNLTCNAHKSYKLYFRRAEKN